MHFTQNPIGSDDQLDLQDNAIALDYAMNSPAALWQDRFGKQHKTVQQALKDVGFKPAGFDFVSGGTLEIGDRDKCVFFPTDGYWYNWNGKLPYVVSANSSPTPGGRKGWSIIVKSGHCIITTVAEVKSGIFKNDDLLEVTDRAGAKFKVLTGIPNGIDKIDAGNGKIAEIQINSGVITAKAFGAKMDWNGETGTDDTSILTRLHELGISYSMDGKFSKISSTLIAKSSQKIYFFGGGFYKPNAGFIFSTNKNAVDGFTCYDGHFIGNLQADLVDFTGAGPGYPMSAKNCKMINCNSIGMRVIFNFDNARVCKVTGGRYAGHTALKYSNKSAECIIESAVLIKDEGLPTIGTKGISSFAGSDGYPEGLTVKDCLLFRFQHNYAIDDLYIGKMHDNYVDSGDDSGISYIAYGSKTEGVDVIGNWFYQRGLIIGTNGAAAPLQYRSNISGNHFNGMVPGVDIELLKWTHGVTIQGNYHDSNQTGDHVCIATLGNNNGIVIGNINPIGYTNYVQMKKFGENNIISNIPNVDNLETPISLDYPVNVYNVEGYFEKKDGLLSTGPYAVGSVIFSADNVQLSSGVAVLSFNLSRIEPSGNGALRIVAYKAGTFDPDPSVIIPHSSGFLQYSSNDTAIRFSSPIIIKKATKTTFAVIVHVGSAQITGGVLGNDGITIVQ